MMALRCGGCSNCTACRMEANGLGSLGMLGAINVKSGKSDGQLLATFPMTSVVPVNLNVRPYSDVFYTSFVGYLKALSTKWNIKKPFLRADVEAILAGSERANQALSWDYISGRMMAAWLWLTFEDVLTGLKAANRNFYPALETRLDIRLNQISRDVNTLEQGFAYMLQPNLGLTAVNTTPSQIYSSLVATVIRTYEIAVLVNSYKIANLSYGYSYNPGQLREIIRSRLQGTPPSDVKVPDEVPESIGDSVADEAAAKAAASQNGSAGAAGRDGSAGAAGKDGAAGAAGKDGMDGKTKDNTKLFLLLGVAAIGGYWLWSKNKNKKKDKKGLSPSSNDLLPPPSL